MYTIILKSSITEEYLQFVYKSDPESYEWGLSARSVGLNEIHSGNDNRTIKHTIYALFQACCYF